MIEQKTIIDQIEIARNGYLQIRFGLLLIENGNELDCKWHRTAIEPGGDVDAQMAVVNTHLQTMGKAQIDLVRIAELKTIAAVIHTPERIAEFRTAVALPVI